MKKMASLVGLAVFLMLVSVDVSATECRSHFGKISPGSHADDSISSNVQTDCTDKKAFLIPAAVPLFLSAIAGLGVVAYRGKIR